MSNEYTIQTDLFDTTTTIDTSITGVAQSPYTIDTLTSGTSTFTLSDTDTLSWDEVDMRRPLTVGDTDLTEDKLKDLLVLLDIIGELDDDNPIKEMFNCKKMLTKLKENDMVASKDPGKGHFYVSLVKSGIRILAGISLVFGGVMLAGALLIGAEVLGIVEEIV